MTMAILEEEVDAAEFEEALLAAMDAAVKRKLGGIQQQTQQQRQHRQFLHPPPPLSSAAPQKKLAITHLPSPALVDSKPPCPPPSSTSAHRQYSAGIKQEVPGIAKAAQISSMNNQQNSHAGPHRNVSVSSGVGRDWKQQGVAKNAVGGGCNLSGQVGSDVKSNGYLKTGGAIVSSGGGPGYDMKREVFSVNGNSSSAGWSGRSPLQEVQPWGSGSREIVEKPSSTTSAWVQEKNYGAQKENNHVAWFSGLSGVATFKECQEAAMRTLLPSDYTMLSGKPYIKKTGWRKIAFFFNVSFEIKDKSIQFDPQANVLRAEFMIRASMPSGRFTDSWGSCDRGEKRFSKPNHDIPSTAETRAKTRACQDLLGIGEYKSDGH